MKVKRKRDELVVVDIRVIAQSNEEYVILRHFVIITGRASSAAEPRGFAIPIVGQLASPSEDTHSVTSRSNRMISASARFNSASISFNGRGGVYL